MTKAKTYTAPHAVFVDGDLKKIGEPFTTSATKGEQWEEVTSAEATAIEAAMPGAPAHISIENMDLSALRALAAEKGIDSTGLGKKELVQALKVANEPRL